MLNDKRVHRVTQTDRCHRPVVFGDNLSLVTSAGQLSFPRTFDAPNSFSPENNSLSTIQPLDIFLVAEMYVGAIVER